MQANSTAPLRIRYLLLSATVGASDLKDEGEAVAEKENLSFAISVILNSAAPTLRALAIHNVSLLPPLGKPLATAPFPHLTHLSVPHFYPSFAADAALPSLRALHISQCAYRLDPRSYADFEFGALLAEGAPRLTYLRLSGLLESYTVLQFLRMHLGVPFTAASWHSDYFLEHDELHAYVEGSPEAARAAAHSAQLNELRHIVVQPGIPRDDDDAEFECTYGAWEHYEMLAGLQDIAKDHARGVGIGELRLLAESAEYTFDEVRRDWEDVIRGGDGPWAMETE
ncbi:hypothetical protein PsYK624_133420 [Phanerochaete sordida]|uniref:Uncharacterized protein n=1 Tax=Phanerochaete sordida TaxID=48140 RepID=A0A9P3GLD6_9APHY|nr:hypothetical protein PsYK624_133420 [Phanerochaete sordida]